MASGPRGPPLLPRNSGIIGDMPLVAGRQAAAAWTPPPNLDDSTLFNDRRVALGVCISFLVLAWTFSLLRLYARIWLVRAVWWDDLLIGLAMLCNAWSTIVFLIMPNYGLGQHISSLSPQGLNEFLKIFYIGSVAYPLSLTFIKLSLLFQYLRIFDPYSWRRRFCKWFIVFVAIWGIFVSLFTWMPCFPVSSLWHFTPGMSSEHRNCWGLMSPNVDVAMAFYVGQSVSTTVLDLMVFLLPVHLIFQKETQRRTRLSLPYLFALGVGVNLCSICRLVYSLKPGFSALYDVTWSSSTPTALAMMEVNLAAICASLAIFWPVLRSRWGGILVTHEVKITREHGIFVPRNGKITRRLRLSNYQGEEEEGGNDEEDEGSGVFAMGYGHTPLAAEQEPAEWDPYVGDEKTGIGDSETIIESPSARPVKVRRLREEQLSLV